VNIRLAQLNPTIGDLSGNKEQILEAIKKASNDSIDLLLLPELIVCGYPPLDLLEREIFRQGCYQVNNEVIEATTGFTVIFGSITQNHGHGRKVYNSAVVAKDGQEITRVHKALLPTYDVFDDLRYFEPGEEFEPIVLEGVPFGITVCEDIWYNDNEINYHTYKVNPAEVLAKKGAKAIINISASPFTKTKPVSRVSMLQRHANEIDLPLFYVNQVGANTELIFDGDSLALNKDGEIISRAKRFADTFIDVSFDASKNEVEQIGDMSGRLDIPDRI